MKLLPALLVAGGCYGYYPTSAPGPVGRDVEVALTDSGSVVLARQIGPSVNAMVGRLVSDSGNAVVVSLASVRQRDGNETSWKGEHVSVPRPLVAHLTERKFSRGRTAVFGSLLAVALVGIREAFSGTGFGSSGSGLPGTGTAK